MNPSNSLVVIIDICVCMYMGVSSRPEKIIFAWNN